MKKPVKSQVKTPKSILHVGVEEPGGALGSLHQLGQPFAANITLRGVSPILFHRFDCDAVEAKARATKNSRAKQTDNLESFVYRDAEGFLCVPGVALHAALVCSAKHNQDPRNPRASMMALAKAGLVVEPHLARFQPSVQTWDFEDRRGVVVNRGRVIRIRPAMREGWRLSFQVRSILAQYITPEVLYELLVRAGQTVGLCDFRPAFGRFLVERFEVGESEEFPLLN